MYSLKRASLYRPHGTVMQPLLECEEPVPPSASVICTDPLLGCVGPLPPSAGVVRTDPAGRSCRLCLLSLPERERSVPCSAGVVFIKITEYPYMLLLCCLHQDHGILLHALAGVPRVITPFLERRRYTPLGTLAH